MKTTDLIPLILYQLVDGDKYGYEIVKQIEDASNGCISIKQPTLYSVLKKLEHCRVISSYWQDSEIGGKRHYYALTPNGKSQLDTYPPFQQLIKEFCGDIEASTETCNEQNAVTSPIVDAIESTEQYNIANNNDLTQNDENSYEYDSSKNDTDINIELENETESQSIEANDKHISPIFTQTENDADTIKPINIFDAIAPSSFADTSNTTPEFVEKAETIVESEDRDSTTLFDKLSPNNELTTYNSAEPEEMIQPNGIELVKYINYVDFNTDEATIKRRNAIKQHIIKMSLTVLSLMIVLAVSLVVGFKLRFGKLYYICAIIVGFVIVLYPALLFRHIPKLRLEYCSKTFKYTLSRDFFVKLSLFLSFIIVIFAYNLSIVNKVSEIFVLSNLSQFLFPIMFASILMLDFVYSIICYKKYR